MRVSELLTEAAKHIANCSCPCAPYNPVKSAGFYLFTEDGKAVRSLPRFPRDNTGSPDELPHCRKHDHGKRCRQAMLMVVTCLEHGCIMGCHLTDSEGRRDVLGPLFKYMKKPPKMINYDYACG